MLSNKCNKISLIFLLRVVAIMLLVNVTSDKRLNLAEPRVEKAEPIRCIATVKKVLVLWISLVFEIKV
jgi:hypothetical protein